MSNFYKRLIVVLLGAPIVIASVHFGFLTFTFFVFLISIVSLLEFYHITHFLGLNPQKLLGVFFAFLVLTGIFLSGPQFNINKISLSILFMCLMTFSFILSLFRKNIDNLFLGVMVTFFGVFYVVWTLGHLISIRNIGLYGTNYIYYLLLTVWLMDSVGYFVGSKYGIHKILPKISPNKSFEGSIASLGMAIIMSLTCKFVFLQHIPLKHIIILAVLIGVFGQLSDFSESLIKRNAHIKNASNILPGHGGMMDRFDSLIFAAPLFYYYLKFVL